MSVLCLEGTAKQAVGERREHDQADDDVDSIALAGEGNARDGHAHHGRGDQQEESQLDNAATHTNDVKASIDMVDCHHPTRGVFLSPPKKI